EEDQTPTIEISAKLDSLMEIIPNISKIKVRLEYLSRKYDDLTAKLREHVKRTKI
ncbi:hypothetical protein J6590_066640, partial [Homalodisca vitripennis]